MELQHGIFVPKRFYFKPTAEELGLHYLLPKIQGVLPPSQGAVMIQDCDLYGSEEEPWEIWERFWDSSSPFLFFFTEGKNKTSGGGKSSSYTVGSLGGTWHAETGPKRTSLNIQSTTAAAVIKKRFIYKNKECPQHDGAWSMVEYSLEESYSDDSSHVVICKLEKMSKKISSSSSSDLLNMEEQQKPYELKNILHEQPGTTSNLHQQDEGTYFRQGDDDSYNVQDFDFDFEGIYSMGYVPLRFTSSFPSAAGVVTQSQNLFSDSDHDLVTQTPASTSCFPVSDCDSDFWTDIDMPF
ncbi:hypothetical protein Tsubulata_030188 [Turnera subulata]|uniref:NAC domain-containing protein n=1 Tax=Turnera subulata TaxID=218843 RepID=A0A9Q0JS37_9ROSI|nr:hypothetical protein Tsubulata_030188 [Turnera subulata]